MPIMTAVAHPANDVPQEESANGGQIVVPGRVILTEGDTIQYPGIYLPDYTEPGLLVSRSESFRDSLVLFDANDVLFIEFWHPQTPEKVVRLYSIHLRRQPHRVAHYWGTLDILTPYGFTVQSYPRYRLSTDGQLEGVPLYGNRAFSRPVFFALHYGDSYYVTWPPDLDSKILDYLSRETDGGEGISPIEYEMLFDNGFSPDDFFDISDLEFGL